MWHPLVSILLDPFNNEVGGLACVWSLFITLVRRSRPNTTLVLMTAIFLPHTKYWICILLSSRYKRNITTVFNFVWYNQLCVPNIIECYSDYLLIIRFGFEENLTRSGKVNLVIFFSIHTKLYLLLTPSVVMLSVHCCFTLLNLNMSNNGAFVTAPSDIVKTYTLGARTQQTYCDIKTSELMKFRRISLPYIFF